FAVNSGGGDTGVAKMRGHEVRMSNRGTECQGASLAMLVPYAKCVSGPRHSRQFVAQEVGVEPAISPGNLTVINVLVIDSIIVKWHQELSAHRLKQSIIKNQIVTAERENL